ncbi:MAG: hypothetical protein LC754_09045 [Acidobacteria bacterium]|nr:hypothetical protein [Acidobacteriota bacterium]
MTCISGIRSKTAARFFRHCGWRKASGSKGTPFLRSIPRAVSKYVRARSSATK